MQHILLQGRRDRRKKILGGVGQVAKSSGRGGATVKLRAFLGRGEAVLKISRARACRKSLHNFRKKFFKG